MKQLVKLLPFLLSAFLVGSPLFAQPTDDYAAKIDSLIQTTSPRSFNGVILITQKGKTKYAKAYGYADFEQKIPLTIKDNFRIQSNSKQVTAVLILKEVEKGKIDLHSPIRKYFPEIQQTWADTVTVHQLLNFSAGIAEIDQPLVFRPGTDFLYSVIAYTMLGNILEKVTGKTYIQAANNLFKELKMHNTFCYEEAKNHNRVVRGYTSSKSGFKISNVPMTEKERLDFIPAGGIISNVEDLHKWDTKLHHGQILKPENYQLMTTYTIMAQHEAHGPEKIGYGYGVRISDKTSIKHIGHSGKGLGSASIKLYFPEKDVDMIVLENQYSEDSSLHYYFEIKIREIVMNSSLVR
ncbi:serine hydrolase [Adhaeribacter arboris]|uniref:Serine hydrolase n=1 Tax=Adhaeribacter arboris TaxID=2072846 RepID=A0A2T2YMH5_9BACT|nr:serine hydrolase domain-containing protein [Adhaeribacter arboris]PSR56714.1 serine hydrolase [Adhaeribacter arboris]